MKNTRLMEILFSNTDEEIAKQVDNDIKSAEGGNSVDSEELAYRNTDDGVAITDKETGEVTLAQRSADDADTYDLVAVPDEDLEKYLHPTDTGKPGQQVSTTTESVEDHMSPEAIDAEGVNPAAGSEPTILEYAEDEVPEEECEECEDEEREFSVTSDNTAFQKIFSFPTEFSDKLFSEVIESAETSNVGNLKIEKCPDEDNAVVVTDKASGDQAKVTLDGDTMEVEELESKNFADSDYLPLYIIGVQPYDHIIVDAQAFTEEAANVLVQRLTEDGVAACQVFDNQEDARDYAINLLKGLGASPEEGDVEEPVLEKEFSDAEIYTAYFSTNDTVFMSKMFSEQEMAVTDTRDAVEQALKAGEAIQIDGAVITPVEATKAVIEDGDQLTLATIQGEDMLLEPLDPEELHEVLNDGAINALADDCEDCEDEGEDEGEEEREFSDIYTNDAETRYFSANEEVNSYMERLFSEEADQNHIEVAINAGHQIETDSEVITPVCEDTAVVEDKETGEFTKVSLVDEDSMNVHPISEDEADNLLGDVEVSEEASVVPEEGDEEIEEGEEKEFSDIYTNDAETRFFSATEPINNYMERLFSEEADQEEIEKAIGDQEVVENDSEVITPVDENLAVVEDKESGEFTKAEILDDDQLELTAITPEEAADLKVGEDKAPEEKPEEKTYSTLDKFFSEVNAHEAAPQEVPEGEEGEEVPTVEVIEDKALAAVESIREAAEAATEAIQEAKEAPAPSAEPEIKEAQFSEKQFSQDANSTLNSWLRNK